MTLEATARRPDWGSHRESPSMPFYHPHTEFHRGYGTSHVSTLLLSAFLARFYYTLQESRKSDTSPTWNSHDLDSVLSSFHSSPHHGFPVSPMGGRDLAPRGPATLIVGVSDQPPAHR